MEKYFNNKLKELEKKYSLIGQDLNSYLEGLLYTNPLSYWDYINLETLLSLQRPKTRQRPYFYVMSNLIF